MEHPTLSDMVYMAHCLRGKQEGFTPLTRGQFAIIVARIYGTN